MFVRRFGQVHVDLTENYRGYFDGTVQYFANPRNYYVNALAGFMGDLFQTDSFQIISFIHDVFGVPITPEEQNILTRGIKESAELAERAREMGD